MLERDVENYLKRKAKPWACLKFTSPGTIGVPDRIILAPNGRTFFVEVKAPGKQPRPSQLAIHRKFEKLGHHVFVVDSYESVDSALGVMRREVT